MKQILILTENYKSDEQLVNNLEYLGYEVLTSHEILEQLILNRPTNFLQVFKSIIISETVSNTKLAVLLKNSTLASSFILRSERPNQTGAEESEEQEYQQKIDAWLSPEDSLYRIRELLASKMNELDNKTVSDLSEESEEHRFEKIKSFRSELSKNEVIVLKILCANQDECISRLKLARKVWSSGPDASRLSQLSQIIKRLRQKLKNSDLPEDLIETNWRKGYKISSELSNNLLELLD